MLSVLRADDSNALRRMAKAGGRASSERRRQSRVAAEKARLEHEDSELYFREKQEREEQMYQAELRAQMHLDIAPLDPDEIAEDTLL